MTDGKETLRVPIEWAFGQGAAGQTYLFQREGRWYESRVSYFAALRGLDLTLGMQNHTPHNLLEAAGRIDRPVEVGAVLRLPRHQRREIAHAGSRLDDRRRAVRALPRLLRSASAQRPAPP